MPAFSRLLPVVAMHVIPCKIPVVSLMRDSTVRRPYGETGHATDTIGSFVQLSSLVRACIWAAGTTPCVLSDRLGSRREAGWSLEVNVRCAKNMQIGVCHGRNE